MTEESQEMELWGGLLPKVETQSYDFLKKNPTMDGRGIIVGVLDTGVDPGAIGLQTTTEGLPKVIDIIDCTGSGDVEMHGPVEADANGNLKGMSGRTILINPDWKNPSGKFRVGVKKLNELYTKSLRNRMKNLRREEFEKHQRNQERAIKEKISLSTSLSKMDQDDLTSQLTSLRDLGKEHSEGVGMLLDCVVYHDGERWQAVVDCTGTGDMSSTTPMTDFDFRQEYRTFSKEDAFNFGVHVYDEGKILSIVVDSGAHGTHVAGIIAAHHPDQPEINGVAPGAQIVSLKIGDSRIDSGETAPGLMRALIEAIRLKVNIINMSFGEAAQFDNTGAFIKLAEEMVYKHGITFVSSAGNNGPNISTVGAPMASCIISVGAFVTKSLMRTAYSLHETNVSNIPESNFTWSSVGPVVDGDMGVSLMAPGGATTCVPNWTLSRNQLMNGTSMSSPNACGCLTLLLSGLKQIQTDEHSSQSSFIVSPPRLRMAAENTCKFIEEVDILGQNNGLIQVEAAWHHLTSNKEDCSLDIPIRFEVLSRRFSRGIYLRQPSECSVSSTFKVEVKPIFDLLPEGDLEETYFSGKTVQQAKINYEMRLNLISSCDWIKAPHNVLLAQAGKVISVEIDPTKLGHGVHVEFIRAYDEKNFKKGCVFKIPITVVVPEVVAPLEVSQIFGTNLRLPQSERVRRFIVPPPGCSYVDVIVRDKRHCSGVSQSTDDSSSRMVVVHALQLLPGEAYRDHEKQSYLHLAPGSEHCVSFPVEAQITLEITVSRFWSTLGDICCDVTIFFRGVTPVPTNVNVYQGQKANSQQSRVRLQAELHSCSVLPSAFLTTWSSTITPVPLKSEKSSRVLPLGERDILPNGKCFYQLLLEYTFEIPEAKDNTVTPRWPVWNDILYESPFSGQFYMLYDSQKQLVSCGDAYADRTSIKLPKGHYSIRLQVKHDDASLLETYDSTPMILERRLDNSISVPCFASQSDALLSSNAANVPLFVGTSCSVVFGEPDVGSLPKSVSAGDIFHGSVTYLKKNSEMMGSGTRPGGYKLTYFYVGARTTKAESSSELSVTKSPDVTEEGCHDKSNKIDDPLEVAIRDAKMKFLADEGRKKISKQVLTEDSSSHPFFQAYTNMILEYPEFVPLHLLALEYFLECVISCSIQSPSFQPPPVPADESKSDEVSDKSQLSRHYVEEAIRIADKIFEMIDKTAIMTELGVLVNSNDSDAAKRRKDITRIKDQLVKALSIKCRVVMLTDESNEIADSFEDTYTELAKWEDVEKSDILWELYVHKNNHMKRFGLSLKRINEVITKEKLRASPSSTVLDKLEQARMNCVRRLGWQHIIDRLVTKNEAAKYDFYLPF